MSAHRRRVPPLDERAIVRERVVRYAGQGDLGPAGELLFAVGAAGLPEPVTELHFAWCCEHLKAEHHSEGTHGWCQACRDEGDPRVVRWDYRHEYEHERDWRFDLAWPEQRLAVEVDGGTHTGGRHVRGRGYEEDAEKLNEAVIRGWRVLRFTTAMVEDGRALDMVERALGR